MHKQVHFVKNRKIETAIEKESKSIERERERERKREREAQCHALLETDLSVVEQPQD